MMCRCGHPKHIHYKFHDGTKPCFSKVFELEDDDPCLCMDYEKDPLTH
jgi:hypothetical protein